MWPLPPLKTDQVTLSIGATYMSCAWISSSKKYPCILKAYQHIPFDDALTSLTVTQRVQNFVNQNNLNHCLLSVALAAPLIHEQFVRLSYSQPTAADINLKKMIWDYRYFHTLDDGHHLLYVCGISQPTLFAQQLLAYKTKLNLIRVTSSYMALVQAYRTLFGPSFRTSQLALDMIKHNYHLQNTFSADSIARMMHIAPTLTIDLEAQKLPLMSMIGLYNQERE